MRKTAAFAPILLGVILLFSPPRLWSDQGPGLAKKDFEALCLAKEDPAACYWAGNAKSAKGETDGAERFFRIGCDLGSLQSCHGLAGTLNLRGVHEEALKISAQNCGNGYLFSCETAGYILKKQGKVAEARGFYLKICSSKDGPRGCGELSELSRSETARKDLQSKCEVNNPWACLAWGMAERDLGNAAQARSVFMDACQRHPDYWGLCGGAMDLIHAPPDVEDYVESERACHHWRGEEAYDQNRGKQIEEAFKKSCVDRRTLFESLTTKYADSPGIVFKLQQAQRLNDDLR